MTGGRIHVKRGTGLTLGANSIAGADDSASGGRAQLLLDSAYSELTVASRQSNVNGHGSTISLATQSATTNDFAKWTIGQGQYNLNSNILSFSYGVNTNNPHGVMGTNNANADMLIIDGGRVDATGQMRAPIYYDRNNTTYYTHPDSTSVMVSLDIRGEINNDGWFRNDTSGRGILNTATGAQFFSDNAIGFDLNSNTTSSRLEMKTQGTLRGSINSDTSNNIGFLNNAGSWRFRIVGADYGLFEGSSARAPIFYDSNNTAYLSNQASTSFFNYLRVNNVYSDESRRFTNPQGGSYTTTTSTVTGAIRISLPTNRFNSNTMLRFTVKLYEYSTGRSTTFDVGGYNNNGNGGTWVNVFAIQTSDGGNKTAYTVRFGRDATRNIIWIGEVGSTWSYPQVNITDLQVGFGGNSTNWGAGWAVTFSTAAATTVTQTRTASLAKTSNNAPNWAHNDYALRYYAQNNTAFYTDPNETSVMQSLDIRGEINNDGWFRNDTSGRGLFSTPNTMYFYSDSTSRFRLRSNTTTVQILMATSGDATRGYLYANNSSNIGFLNSAASWSLRVDNSGNTFATASHRAPIFYDNNDTAYYTDPNSTGRSARMRGDIFIGSNTSNYFLQVGGNGRESVNATTTGSIAMTSNLHIDAASTTATYINYYDGTGGIYFGAGNNTSHSRVTNGGLWAIGDITTFTHRMNVNGTLQASSSLRAPLYYDSNNTAFVINGEGTSRLTTLDIDNAIRHSGDTDTYMQFHAANEWRVVTGGAQRLEVNNSLVTAVGQIRATSFSDANNTARICDPTGVSALEHIALYGQIRAGASSNPYIDMISGMNVFIATGYTFQAGFSETRMSGPARALRYTSTVGVAGQEMEITSNTTSAHTSLRINNVRGSYWGFAMPEIATLPHIMYSSNGNGGAYTQSGGAWQWFWNHANRCLGINGSTAPSTYELYVSGDIFATGNITAFSDRRKKENIKTIENALDKVLQLRGVTYNKIQTEKEKEIKDLKGRSEIGLIAQEVLEIVPEVVSYADDVDEYGVNYSNLVGLLVEGMKDQNKIINSQQEQIDELKEMVAKLMEKL